jgi:acyl-lipid omega-6 desaturase (Delta-12 desaturase)
MTPDPKLIVADWKRVAREFQEASTRRAVWQLANTLVPYAVLWIMLYFWRRDAYWLTLPIAAIAGLLAVRIFIIFHDCCHGCFFPARWANTITGFLTGTLVFTPFTHWRWQHSIHHATSGDLDHRGTGDIWTMTVREYVESSCWTRLTYRLARHPVILFVITPVFLFIIWQRLSSKDARPSVRLSVWWSNIVIVGLVGALGSLFGWKTYTLMQLVVMAVAGAFGVWMFYVQHQFEGAYWERRAEWGFAAAALQGSSYYRLPKILQWLSGNIGFHHVHHLNSRIPNYNLQRCHQANDIFRTVKTVSFSESLGYVRLNLWDEERRKLISFRHLKHLQRKKCLTTISRTTA